MPRSTSLPSRKQHDMPKCLDYEEGLLGLFMVKPDTIDGHKDLSQELWGNPLHYVLYDAMRRMRELGKPIGLLELTGFMRMEGTLDQLKQGDSDGASFITAIYSRATDNDKSDFFIAEMRTKYAHRQGISLMSKCMDSLIAAKHADMQTIFDTVTDYCKQACDLCVEEKEEKHEDFLIQYLDVLDDRVKQRTKKPGIPPPFPMMERESGMLRYGKLTVIIGDKGAGKSILGNQIIGHASLELGIPSAEFSLEMPKEECVDRLLAYQSKIHLTNLVEGKMGKGEMDRCTTGITTLAKAPVRIYDSFTTPEGIEAKIRSLSRNFGLKLALVDYLQLLKLTGEKKDSRRDQDLTSVTTRFKRLAIELDMHIILISAATFLKNGEIVIRESKGCEYDADNIFKLTCCKDTQMLNRLYVDKWRGGKAKYGINVTPHFEFCRIIEKLP